jgi:hypothetical protein
MAKGRSDRRATARFPLALPVELPDGRGVTRDVSEHGVFIESDQSVAVGRSLRFFLFFNDGDGSIRVPCDGAVVRVDADGRRGFAARITSYTLEAHDHGNPFRGSAPGRGR